MKCAFMTFSTPEMTFEEVLVLARDLGYDAVEVRVSAKHRHGVEPDSTQGAREAVRRLVDEVGVPICCVATSCRFADPALTEDNVAQAHSCIDLAADVGSPFIRVFGGQLAEGMDRGAAVHQVAGALSALADHAADRGVTVCMETHDDWCRPADVAQVIERVGHPAIAVNWDIMHPVRRGGATMDEAFRTLAPWVRHCHFHDGTVGDAPESRRVGKGDIDHGRAIELLQAAGYDGYMSGEWINAGPHEDYLADELAAMRAYESQG